MLMLPALHSKWLYVLEKRVAREFLKSLLFVQFVSSAVLKWCLPCSRKTTEKLEAGRQ